MATEYTEGTSTRVRTSDGFLEVTVLERISVDRIMLMLVRGVAAARFKGVADSTPLVDESVKDLLLNPLSEE